MARAFLIVLDSVGCGGAPDAAVFGDAGANTLLHIAEACANGTADQGRKGALHLPNLDRLGLGAAIALSGGQAAPGLSATGPAAQGSFWGAAQEVSNGKDTPSGHWELAGVPVPWDWTLFPDRQPAFPEDLVAEVCRLAGVDGILGNCHASGIPVITRFCAEHQRTGWPICYTSADSVFQIAAHEEWFGLERLLKLCADLAPFLHQRRVGRVIARPFTGDCDNFRRTANRRDFAHAPPAPTLPEHIAAAGGATHGIGKIGDIFSMRGIGKLWKGQSDTDLFEHLVTLGDQAEEGALVFANFVEFDTLYGHPRDVAGYARALEWFDAALPRFLTRLRPGDLAVFTADHGNDPTWKGTEHTRERVPVLGFAPGAAPAGSIGVRAFADVGTSVAAHLGVALPGPGRSFL
ncbi:phosphopentomutase [Xinfangfangia sp. D13-10-4-6]|uniref:phosphopentomutase n=1 Tax=Pseudogemmobacter hezensis TaxID=2737662 RepID=UPI001554868E|nr:phosphopentomutase [Pseudogemmobacter hezensis]NPD14583.1 phosphopentomutase [Pseudogemmobacter hezensis]